MSRMKQAQWATGQLCGPHGAELCRQPSCAPEGLPPSPFPDLDALLRDRSHFPEHWEPPAIEWVIPGVIPDGYSIIAGRPKTGKSYLLLDALLAVASGGRCLGSIDVEQGDVCYMAMEDTEGRVVRRARQVTGSRLLPEGFAFLSREAVPLLRKHGVRPYLEHLKGLRPGLRWVVLDTTAIIKPPRERGRSDIAEDDYRFGQGIAAAARDLDLAITGVVHASQESAGSDPLDRVAGTYGVTAAADSVALLARDRESQEGVLAGTSREGRDYRIGLAAKSDGGWRAVDGVPVVVDGHLGRRSREALALVAAGTGSTAGVAAGLGISSDRASEVLGRLAAAGRVVRVGRGEWRVDP